MSHRLLQLRLHTGIRPKAVARSACRCAKFPTLPSHLHAKQSIRRPLSSRAVALDSDASVLSPENADLPRHVPVMLSEVLTAFRPVRLKECRNFVGIDVDPTAHDLAEKTLQHVQPAQTSIKLLLGNFGNVTQLLQQLPGNLHSGGTDGILLDLGISSMQVDEADRGFSFSKDAPLDMRMGPDAVASAEQIINTWPESELGRVFKEYGEERHWKGIASRIAQARQTESIRSTSQLVSLIGRSRRSQTGGKQIHPATRVFQALRIAVNQELQMLEQALPATITCLAPHGRLLVISFHSLEDRIVKRAFLKAAGRGPSDGDSYGAYLMPPEEEQKALVKLVTKKPLSPGEEELKANPRSRSAKLRIAEKL